MFWTHLFVLVYCFVVQCRYLSKSFLLILQIYVWLNALINYLTVAGFPDDLQNWPADIQIVGQDIIK